MSRLAQLLAACSPWRKKAPPITIELGQAWLRSRQGERLRVDIPLPNLPASELSHLRIRVDAAAGAVGQAQLTPLQLTIALRETDSWCHFICLTSRWPIKQSRVRLRLNTELPNGKGFRLYSLRLRESSAAPSIAKPVTRTSVQEQHLRSQGGVSQREVPEKATPPRLAQAPSGAPPGTSANPEWLVQEVARLQRAVGHLARIAERQRHLTTAINAHDLAREHQAVLQLQQKAQVAVGVSRATQQKLDNYVRLTETLHNTMQALRQELRLPPQLPTAPAILLAAARAIS